MQILVRFYRLLTNLSIDVACGSVITAMFFADIFQSTIKPHGLLVLFLAVWVIYTTDHLIDSRKVTHTASSARHQFHQRNFKLISILAGCAVVLIIVLLFFVRTPIIISGIVLGVLVFVYLLVNHLTSSLKEFLVAVLYTCGVVLPAFAVSPHIINTEIFFFILEVFLLAFINLLLFSFYDHDNDRRDGFSSFVVVHGEAFSIKALWLLFLCLVGLLIYHLVQYPSKHVIIIAMMMATLLILFLFKNTLAKSDAYRFVGDLIFLYPVLLWI